MYRTDNDVQQAADVPETATRWGRRRKNARYYYRAYGLAICSSIALPELTPRAPSPEVDVRIRTSRLPAPPEATSFCHTATLDEARLYAPHLGAFHVRGGCDILVDALPEAEPLLLRSYLTGVMLGILLHQRGLFVLHASGVAMDGGIVGFAGPKGWGKSTTAALLHRRGHPFAADDVLALQLRSAQCPIVLPGPMQMKLWPEAATAVGEDPDALPRLHSAAEKRIKHDVDSRVTTPLPLRCLFVLDAGPEVATTPLTPLQAHMELVHHSYAPRFVGTAGTPARHFYQCSALAEQVPLVRLHRRQDLRTLSEVVAHVEAYVATLPAG